MKRDPSSDAALDALGSVLDRVQDYFRDNEGDGLKPLKGRPESWSFVHWRTRDVVDQLQLARGQFPERQTPKLLECGAGFGFVADLARELGFGVTGLEVDPRYVSWARRLFPLTRVIEQDLLTYQDWGSWDVIYYYAPFHDARPEIATSFEETLEEQLKPGGVIIANHKVSERWKTDPRFQELRAESDIAYVFRKRTD